MLWEAQFGDFVNGAQIVDRPVHRRRPLEVGADLAADAAPPARLRGQRARALERAARAVPPARARRRTSASRTARRPRSTSTCCAARRSTPTARPLVVMTPKGLLRLKQAASTLDELADGRFQPVLDDPRRRRTARSRRLVLCSGKVYYDIVGHEARAAARGRRGRAARAALSVPGRRAAPSSLAALPARSTRSSGRRRSRRTWAPGASIRHRLEEAAAPTVVPLRYVGRPWRASPSEGYPTAHLLEQDRIVREALGVAELGSGRPVGGERSLPRRPPRRRAGRACGRPRGSTRRCAGGRRRHSRKAARPSASGLAGAGIRQSKHTRAAPGGAPGAGYTGRGQRRLRHEDRRIDDDRDTYSREPVHGGGRRCGRQLVALARRSRSTSS